MNPLIALTRKKNSQINFHKVHLSFFLLFYFILHDTMNITNIVAYPFKKNGIYAAERPYK